MQIVADRLLAVAGSRALKRALGAHFIEDWTKRKLCFFRVGAGRNLGTARQVSHEVSVVGMKLFGRLFAQRFADPTHTYTVDDGIHVSYVVPLEKTVSMERID